MRIRSLIPLAALAACTVSRPPASVASPSTARAARARAAQEARAARHATLGADLAAAETRWTRWAPAAYDLDLEEICFCSPSSVRGILTVRGDSITAVVDTLGRPLADPMARRLRYTVPALFTLLRTRHADPRRWSVGATFDSTAGYPTRLNVENEQVPDVGDGFVIHSVRRRG